MRLPNPFQITAAPIRAESRMPALDGARGLAVLLVLGSHLSNAGMHALPFSLSGVGKYGVYLFFSLSAFLLTDQLMRISNEDFRKWNTWLRYALRRVLRIYPMFSFIVLLGYLATPHGLFLYQMSWDVAVQHLLLQRGDSVLWSVPVEMAYYVALPFVAIALRACRDTTSAVAMTVAAITLSTALWPPGDWPENSTHLGYYLPVFFAGSFAAFLNIRCNLSRNLVHLAWVPILGVVLLTPSIYSAIVLPVPPTAFSASFILLGTLWGLFLLTVSRGDGAIAKLLQSQPLRFVGRISFSLYLLHEPVIRVIASLPPLPPASQAVIVTATSIALAYVAFLVIERPANQVFSLSSSQPRVIQPHPVHPTAGSSF